MFGLLVRDENLKIVEVALAVVTPWSLERSVWIPCTSCLRMSYLELLVQIWIPLALLRHLRGRYE
jgi:hypothetical protein